jgi:large subunit ribosomal protein L18
MENSRIKNSQNKIKRALRVRQKLHGTAMKPRMCVVKTNKHIQVQLINDEEGKTLAALSTCSKELAKTEATKKNKASAKIIGEKIAEKAKKLGISQVVFDRGPFRFHGILAELADSARAGGLQF